MEETPSSIFDNDVDNFDPPRRITLLPWAIYACSWIFMILGGLTVLSCILSLAGFPVILALYGLSTTEVYSPVGLVLSSIFLLKGIIGYGLWAEKKWAVNVAIADAALGVVICIYTMVVQTYIDSGMPFNFRLELIILFFYLRKLLKIRTDWENYAGQ